MSADPDGVASLRAERARASFNSDELEAELRGGADAVASRRALLTQLQADPVLGAGRLDDAFLSREQKFEVRLERAARVRAVHLRGADASRLRTYDSLRLHREGGVLEKAGGFALHIGMFMPTIELLGTEEQAREWLPLARTCAILGTYAQSELGHGTNLARLETTATFDPASDAFVLHSPTVTSTKWWPGGLGKTSTHAVVMANLQLGGQWRGQHAFLVQLRDLRTHAPLTGVELGDIGPKMGYASVDNGFLRLTHVRVPRAQLLQRHARVGRDGSYTLLSSEPKAVYGTMLVIRTWWTKPASHCSTQPPSPRDTRRSGGRAAQGPSSGSCSTTPRSRRGSSP